MTIASTSISTLEFQFLIGRLKTGSIIEGELVKLGQFQFLIGRLKTLSKKLKLPIIY